MKAGKLSGKELEELIFSLLGKRRKDVLVHPGIGEDCAVIDFEKDVLIISSDPITGAEAGIGKLAVNIACNDIAACGGEPVGIQVMVLFPPQKPRRILKEIMSEVEKEAQKLNIDVLGGHTEATSAVNQIVLATTAIGRAPKYRYVTSDKARVGDQILVTRGIGLEGVAILAWDHNEVLSELNVSSETIQEAKNFIELISVVKEGLISSEFGVHAMHDITEGGLLGALWEVAQASGVGFEIYRDRVPVPGAVREICTALDLDPLKLISSGSMLIITDRGEELVGLLKQEGIVARVIGRVVREGYSLIDRDKREIVHPPFKDELWRWLEEQAR